MDILFFETPKDLRQWFNKNHHKLDEQWIGYYKKGTGLKSITWPESVDEALCFGWIDGIRKSIDEKSYKIRFTPRRPGSIWSAVNVKRAEELISLERMKPSGLKAFRKREEKKTNRYSFEQKTVKLDPSYEKKFKENIKAWDFFIGRAPSYKRTAVWWVMSAKKEETQIRRLTALIEASEKKKKPSAFI